MIVLPVSGKAVVAADADTVTLAPGQAAFVAARDSGVTLSGSGGVFVATDGMAVQGRHGTGSHD
jgi:mannose-6-phosphate isomerase class I